MVEVWFPPSVPFARAYQEGLIAFRHKEHSEYLGIAQQLFAQTIGWA